MSKETATTHEEDGDGTKCPCCNNPWAAATGDFFAKLCETCNDEDEEKTKRPTMLDQTNIDDAISPSDNFYTHSNGKWMEKNPIPSGYPNWNTFLILHTQSQERLRDLLADEGKDGGGGGGDDEGGGNRDAEKVAVFYAAAMDEETIEREGIASLGPVLQLVERTFRAATAVEESATTDGKAVASAEMATCLGEMLALYGVSAFFGIYASPDKKNSTHTTCQVAQGGIGLPDKDYYFDEDKEEKRSAYKKHVAKMLTLLHKHQTTTTTAEDDATATASAEAIYNLEHQLAEAHMTKTQNRDPEETYNPMSLSSLSSTLCNDTFDFPAFFSAATGGRSTESLGELNVANTAALVCAAGAIATVRPSVLRDYLRWRVVQSTADYLSKDYVEEDFDFNERALKGTDEMKPRWKRAMAFTEGALGEALGQMYCAKYFDEGCKEKALTIVENVRQALEDRLKEVDWIASDTTREAALQKMKNFKVKIGYPNKWIDYSALDIGTEDSFLDMIFKSRAFDHNLEVEQMNAPTDTEKWFMTPQTINAYYHPMLNEIVFPAAILQPPFFDRDADDALNYGAMGSVVGHEMTHGFDDKGRKFNADGNMIDWWTKEDAEEYGKRVGVMVQQANAVEVFGQSVKGELTCGENIADLGGLRLALRALKAQPGFSQDEAAEANGLTSTQRFFYGWSQCWRQNINKERALQLLTIDPHGPNEMRCNGPLSNMQEFLDAFDVSEDSPMYKAPKDRVDIW